MRNHVSRRIDPRNLLRIADPTKARGRGRRAGLAIESLEARVLLSDARATPATPAGLAAAEVHAARATAPTPPEQRLANARYLSALDRSLAGQALAEGTYERLRAELNDGQTRARVAGELLRTPRAREQQVRDVYLALLKRAPDAAELRAGTRELGPGGQPWRLIATRAASAEYYRAAGGTAAGFVAALGRDLLGRPVAPAEAARLEGILARGGSRQEVALSLLNRPAARQAIAVARATMDFPVAFTPATLRRTLQVAGNAGYARSLAVLVGSPEYFDAAQGFTDRGPGPRSPAGSTPPTLGAPGAAAPIRLDVAASAPRLATTSGLESPASRGTVATAQVSGGDGQAGGYGSTVDVLPRSYAMVNGGSGSLSYHDARYDGAGELGTDYAPLDGGLGTLTDGQTGRADFSLDNTDWVGWLGVSPAITFDFGQARPTSDLRTFSTFVNNSGRGGVNVYAAVDVEFSLDGQSWFGQAKFKPDLGALSAGWINNTLDTSASAGRDYRYIRTTFTAQPAAWIFLAEVRFGAAPGDLVAEPAALPVTSYAMPDGNSHTFQYYGTQTLHYWDTTYRAPAGPAVRNGDNAPLAGGAGKLTDGDLGPDDWRDDDAASYVAWTGIDPVLTFDLGKPTDLKAVRIFTNNANGAELFRSADIETSDDGASWSRLATVVPAAYQFNDPGTRLINYNVASPAQADAGTADTPRYVRLTLRQASSSSFIFVSEVQFYGQDAPLAPVSYRMANGSTNNGDPYFLDTTYSAGAGASTPGATLDGGLGKLTDGKISNHADWTRDRADGDAPFVGWDSSVTPTIDFDFGSPVQIDSVSLFLDAVSAGGLDIAAPYSVSLQFGDGRAWSAPSIYTLSAAEKASAQYPWFTYRINRASEDATTTGVQARFARLTLTPSSGQQVVLGGQDASAGGGVGVGPAVQVLKPNLLLAEVQFGGSRATTAPAEPTLIATSPGPDPRFTYDFGAQTALRSATVAGTAGASGPPYARVAYEFSNDNATWVDKSTFLAPAAGQASIANEFNLYELDGTIPRFRYVRATVTPAAGAAVEGIRFEREPDLAALTVKRVPGYLNVSPYTATPYLVSPAPGRSINVSTDGTRSDVDYWAISLNGGDAVEVDLNNSGVVARIWDPSGREVAPTRYLDAAGGRVAIYKAPAGADGQYLIGLAATGNARYAPRPDAAVDPVAGGSTLFYRADFKTYPGAKSSLTSLLAGYHDPATLGTDVAQPDDVDWPDWSVEQQAAYDVLDQLASNAENNNNPDLAGYVSFKKPGTIASNTYLNKTWVLYQAAQQSGDLPRPRGSLAQVAPTAADFDAVYTQIAAADAARASLGVFLTNYTTWYQQQEFTLFGDSTGVANIIQTGLTAVPPLASAVDADQTASDTAVDVIVAAGVAAVAVVAPEVEAVAIVGAALLTGAGDLLKAGSESDTRASDDSTTKFTTAFDVATASQQIDARIKANFGAAYNLIDPTKPVAVAASGNLGLLKALRLAAFGYSATDNSGTGITGANALKDAYDQNLYRQLVPRVFSWQSTNGRGDSNASGGRNFHPLQLQGTYSREAASGGFPYYETYDANYGYYNATGTVVVPPQNARDGVRREAKQLQDGGAYDYPVSSYIVMYGEQGGQIALVPPSQFATTPTPTTIAGQARRFYTMGAADINASVTFDEPKDDSLGVDFNGTGLVVNEWGLFTRDGAAEMSGPLARILYGTTRPLVFGPSERAAAGGSYLDWKVGDGGFVTRADAFLRWGQDIPGYYQDNLVPYSAPTTLTGSHVENFGSSSFGYRYKSS